MYLIHFTSLFIATFAGHDLIYHPTHEPTHEPTEIPSYNPTNSHSPTCQGLFEYGPTCVPSTSPTYSPTNYPTLIFFLWGGCIF